MVESVSQLAWKGAVRAGVRSVVAARGVGGTVGRGGDEGSFHAKSDVVLAHAEADGACSPLRWMSMTSSTTGSPAASAISLRFLPTQEGSGVKRERRIEEPPSRPRRPWAISSRSCLPLVGSSASLAKALAIALDGPVGDDHGAQGRARGDVGVLIGGDGQALVNGGLDAVAGGFEVAPVCLAAGFQV